jgi:probable F420-dependent oxidoreductase
MRRATIVELGRYGVFGRASVLTVERARDLESLGYGTVWQGGSPPADLAHAEAILEATNAVTVATGIVNVWRAEPTAVARSYHRIEAAHPGRFLLGIGVGHPESTADYHSPYQTLVDYLAMSSTPRACRPSGGCSPRWGRRCCVSRPSARPVPTLTW